MERRGQNVSGEGRDVYGAVVTHRFFDVLRPGGESARMEKITA